MSNSQYLNDKLESKWIRKVIPECEKQWDKRFDRLSILKISKILTNYNEEVYVACFSECKDVLSQWRGYSDEGHGVSIGFDPSILKKMLSDNLKFASVIYYKDDQISNINQILQKYIPCQHVALNEKNTHTPYHHIHENIHQDELASYIKEVTSISAKEIKNNKIYHYEESVRLSTCIKELTSLSYLLKNPAFHEEKEYRLCYFPERKNDLIKEKKFISKKQYRYSQRKIIPFYSFTFEEKKNLIKEIVLGPKSQLNTLAVRSLLKSYGYKNVRISKSAASYR